MHNASEFYYPEHPEMKEDFTINQDYHKYKKDHHATWKFLYERQSKLLEGRACNAYMDALKHLDFSHERIPNFDDFSDKLMKATGWQVVAVPGLIPDYTFFKHLSERKFPVTNWIRSQHQLDYLQEPDIFHDFFGHVPLLANPVFADYMHAYGVGGVRAMDLGGERYLKFLARLYWFTVEFGLMIDDGNLRIYGAGIVSSKGESVYCLDSEVPHRIYFDIKRIMRTEYVIDRFQENYFVIHDFKELFNETKQDFEPLYHEVEDLGDIAMGEKLTTDMKI